MRKAYSPHRGLALALGLGALLAGAGCNDTDERPATWSFISATIIQPNCATSRCHSEGSNVADLKLDTAKSGYESLAGYVLGGEADPDATGLMVRLNGGYPGIDDVQRMPIDEPLPQADVELIRKWIAAGAPNN
jgi:hypothetical protein